jgi:hypothetical protein
MSTFYKPSIRFKLPVATIQDLRIVEVLNVPGSNRFRRAFHPEAYAGDRAGDMVMTECRRKTEASNSLRALDIGQHLFTWS